MTRRFPLTLVLLMGACVYHPRSLNGIAGDEAATTGDSSGDAAPGDPLFPGDCSAIPDAVLCAARAYECGNVVVTDNCGTRRTISCGDCSGAETCGGGGERNVCGSPTWVPLDGSDFGPSTELLTWGSAEVGGISGSAAQSTNPSAAIDSSGRSVVAYEEGPAVRVRRHDGGEIGVFLGTEPSLIAGSSNGELWLAWRDDGTSGSHQIYVLRFDGSDWHEVGSGSATGGGVSDTAGPSNTPSLALDAGDLPVVAWSDGTSGVQEIYCKRFDGAAWVASPGAATGGGISDTTGASQVPSLAVDDAGQLVIAWQDGSANLQIFARRFSAGLWSAVGPGSASGTGVSGTTAPSRTPSLAALTGGRLALAWQEGSPGEIFVRQFDGSTWGEMGTGSASGGGVSDTSAASAAPSLVTTPSGDAPTLAWYDLAGGSGTIQQIWVKRFDGGAWSELGTGSASGGGISNSPGVSIFPSVAVRSSSHAVVAWQDRPPYSSGSEIYVRTWNGSTWIQDPGTGVRGGVSDTAGDSTSPSIGMTDDGRTTVAWTENVADDNYEIFVRRRLSGSWLELLGSASNGGISDLGNVSRLPSVAVDGLGDPTVAWEYFEPGNPPQVYLLDWQTDSWAELAGSASATGISASADAVTAPELVVDSAGAPVVAWVEGIQPTADAYVLRWDGLDWAELGGSASGGGVSNTAGVWAVALAIDTSSGHPVIAWEDKSGTSQIFLKRWAGNAWVELDGSASGDGVSASSTSSRDPALALDGTDNPIVVWADINDTHLDIRARRWSGTAWIELGAGSASGGGISDTPGGSGVPCVTVDGAGEPWVAWEDSSASNTQIYARRFDGAGWVEIGPSSAHDGGVSNSGAPSVAPDIAASSDQVCIAWEEPTPAGSQIAVRCADY